MALAPLIQIKFRTLSGKNKQISIQVRKNK